MVVVPKATVRTVVLEHQAICWVFANAASSLPTDDGYVPKQARSR
jgi:hypothetical protein